ncbi:MAG: hypothetical protein EZS28_019725, partial [Streblomastix strix]
KKVKLFLVVFYEKQYVNKQIKAKDQEEDSVYLVPLDQQKALSGDFDIIVLDIILLNELMVKLFLIQVEQDIIIQVKQDTITQVMEKQISQDSKQDMFIQCSKQDIIKQVEQDMYKLDVTTEDSYCAVNLDLF